MPATAAVPARPPVLWVVTDGKPGMENQCLGLAEALGLSPVVKRIAPRLPWRALPPRLWLAPLAAPGPGGDSLAPPWPDLLIATGRQTAALSAAIRRRSPSTFTVQIQNPKLDLARFDMVVVPLHDRLSGANVVPTRGALHRVTLQRLADAAAKWRPALAHLPHPRVAVLVGGSNRHYRLTEAAMERLADGLVRLCEVDGVGLMVTPSRRTGQANEARLRARLAGRPAVVWDGSGENPYFAYLGLADAVVVTGDSVSMVSEACATGKPVHLFELPGGSAKFRRFHQMLLDSGVVRRFVDRLEHWTYAPLDDTARVAAEVARRAGWSATAASRHGQSD